MNRGFSQIFKQSRSSSYMCKSKFNFAIPNKISTIGIFSEIQSMIAKSVLVPNTFNLINLR